MAVTYDFSVQTFDSSVHVDDVDGVSEYKSGWSNVLVVVFAAAASTLVRNIRSYKETTVRRSV